MFRTGNHSRKPSNYKLKDVASVRQRKKKEEEKEEVIKSIYSEKFCVLPAGVEPMNFKVPVGCSNH